MHSGKIFEDFVFTVLEGQICYLAHILCSCTRQYECDNVLDGCWLDTGSEAVPGQIFVSVNFRGPGFIHEYREFLHRKNKYVYGNNHLGATIH